jgi:hypothetical protein
MLPKEYFPKTYPLPPTGVSIAEGRFFVGRAEKIYLTLKRKNGILLPFYVKQRKSNF